MATEQIPDFLTEADVDEETFLRELGIEPRELSDTADLDAHIDALIEKVADAKREQEQNANVAGQRVQSIVEWLDGENAVLQRRVERIEGRIRDLTIGYDYGSKKSRSLPSGKFGVRSVPPTVRIEDMDAAVRYAEQNGIDVKVKRTVGVTPLAKLFRETGEVADGCTDVPGEERFYVTPKGG